jgi:hypothetical protein
MIKNERTFPTYILLLLLWFFITFFSPSYQQEGYAREWPHLIPSVVIFLCNVLLFPAFRWYNHRDVKKQTEPQSLQSDRISPFLCRECGLIYLQAATLMLQFKVRHYDPSQQLNRKMAAFPNGCGHFLFPVYITLRKWDNNRGHLYDRPHFRFEPRGMCGHFLLYSGIAGAIILFVLSST